MESMVIWGYKLLPIVKKKMAVEIFINIGPYGRKMHEQVDILTSLFLGACVTRNEDMLVIIHCVRMNVCEFF